MKTLSDVTLVIAGPVKSRQTELELIEKIKHLQYLIDKTGLSVIFSTYEFELSMNILKSPNLEIIINEDPGSDQANLNGTYLKTPDYRNTSRMLISTLAGVKKVKTKYTVKTRIELMPVNDKFIKICTESIDILKNNEKAVLFLGNHYRGIGIQNYHKSGQLGWLPDTFQIMRTTEIVNVWQNAFYIWDKNKKYWLSRKTVYPVSNEQIIGISYIQCRSNFQQKFKIQKFHRYTLSVRMLYFQYRLEKSSFRALNYEDSGLSYWKPLKSEQEIVLIEKDCYVRRKFRTFFCMRDFYFVYRFINMNYLMKLRSRVICAKNFLLSLN